VAHFGGSIRKAAKAAGLDESTVRRSLRKEQGNTVKGKHPAGIDVHTHPAGAEISRLQDRVRTLQATIQSQRREDLTAEYVKAKIIELRDAKVSPPKWLSSPKAAKGRSQSVPTLFASDWHFGEVVNPAEIGNVNEYNVEIAHVRARRLVNNAIDLLRNHMSGVDYPGIVFALGGDMVSGDIHEELSESNELAMMPIIIDLVGVLSWCIKTLADEFGAVFVPCVVGNHGRTTRKPRAKGRVFSNFDWLTYQLLRRDFVNDRRITFSIPDGSDVTYKVFGTRYNLNHGDQFRGGDGIIGPIGPIVRGDQRKRSRQSQVNSPYDVMIIGHWHQYIHLRKLITNGSLKGYDEYAWVSNFPFEPPSQALWLTHPQYGVTISMPVYVDEKKDRVASDWVSIPDAKVAVSAKRKGRLH
jgi:hypothetical protein